MSYKSSFLCQKSDAPLHLRSQSSSPANGDRPKSRWRETLRSHVSPSTSAEDRGRPDRLEEDGPSSNPEVFAGFHVSLSRGENMCIYIYICVCVSSCDTWCAQQNPFDHLEAITRLVPLSLRKKSVQARSNLHAAPGEPRRLQIDSRRPERSMGAPQCQRTTTTPGSGASDRDLRGYISLHQPPRLRVLVYCNNRLFLVGAGLPAYASFNAEKLTLAIQT